MKNFIGTIKKSGPVKKRRSFAIPDHELDINGQLTLFALMEHISLEKTNRLSALQLGGDFQENIHNVDMTFYENARANDVLILESSFTRHNKKKAALKIYISKQTPGQSAARVCKAVYILSVSY